MRPRRRQIGGVWFTCLTPGNWLSEDGNIAALHMMARTSVAAWELYLTKLAKGDVRRNPKRLDWRVSTEFLCADYWCGAYSFGELASDIAKLADWGHNLAHNLTEVAKTQHQYLCWGFGPPDPKLGWEQYEEGRKAKCPILPRSR